MGPQPTKVKYLIEEHNWVLSNTSISTGTDDPLLHHSCLFRAGTSPKITLWLGPLSHSFLFLCGHDPYVCVNVCGMCVVQCICESVCVLCLFVLHRFHTHSAWCHASRTDSIRSIAWAAPHQYYKHLPPQMYPLKITIEKMKMEATDRSKIFTNHIHVSRIHNEVSKLNYEKNDQVFDVGKKIEQTFFQSGAVGG